MHCVVTCLSCHFTLPAAREPHALSIGLSKDCPTLSPSDICIHWPSFLNRLPSTIFHSCLACPPAGLRSTGTSWTFRVSQPCTTRICKSVFTYLCCHPEFFFLYRQCPLKAGPGLFLLCRSDNRDRVCSSFHPST